MAEENQVSQEIIDRATSMGWIPKEQFKGDESRWRPADEYVQRADELMPIMKSQMSKYEQKIAQQEAEITGLKTNLTAQEETAQKLVKMSEKAQKMAYERAKKDIIAQQAQAVKDGDADKWQELETQKESLERPEEIVIEKPPPPQPAVNPSFEQFKASNSWFDKDEDMTIYANSYGAVVKEKNPTMTYEQILGEVERKVKEVFPHKFENPNRQAPTSVDTGTPVLTTPKKQSYESLPDDAKAQCDSLVAQKILTKEQYVKDYYEEG